MQNHKARKSNIFLKKTLNKYKYNWGKFICHFCHKAINNNKRIDKNDIEMFRTEMCHMGFYYDEFKII